MTTEKTTPKRKLRLNLFPYIPGRPEWKTVPFAAAKAVSPAHSTFVGHKDGSFYFQETGNPTLVKVTL